MEKDILSCKLDRISDLPEDVTNSILTFLPLREVVRTSILSAKWRYRWIKLSKLVFDETICQVPEDNKSLTRYKLISTINKILLLHVGPIVEFSLSLSALDSCPKIDHLMIFLSKCSLQAFGLEIGNDETYEIGNDETYKLHSSFFSCSDLRHLNLSNCIFTPPSAFNGFRKLVSLKFASVDFPVDEFDVFISRCPELEILTLIDPPEFHCLALSSPNLKCIYFDGVCNYVSFGEFPLLQSASFHFEGLSQNLEEEEMCRFAEFFCCLPLLKELVTNYFLLMHLAVGGGVPEKLPTPLALETLELSMISLDVLYEVSSIFCLISSCPNIQTIEIKIYDGTSYGDEAEALDFLKAQYCTADVILDELREVHLIDVLGIEPEFEFIKLLLTKSPALETLLIKPKQKDDLSRLKLLEKMIRFQRASSIAEIILE